MIELQITAKNMELTPEVRRYIERKLGRLDRNMPNINESKVEISEEKTKSPRQRFVVQMTVDSRGTLLRSEERGKDLFSAVDKVTAIMKRQVAHYKDRLYDKGRRSSPARSELQEATEAVAPPARVVKVKKFTVKPMSVAEAISQMELLGHDFFLFFSAESEEINLVYRRHDGDYGLIMPELD